ncbi:MAG: hypothetical protein R3326_07365 [Gemmatimonadota bacterium]|nr:hypothetical protein [Gemmatimonadota bacterium]
MPDEIPLAAGRVAVLLLACLALAVTPGRAQEEDDASEPPRGVDCSSPDHRAFDFWLGEWDVYDPKGEKVGENTITVIEDGCALRERWVSSAGNTGRSLNYYDASTGKWYQTWVASSGRPLRLVGGREGDAMVMGMETPAIHHRITWTPNEDGSVRQHWEISRDGGESWETGFDGEYRPRAAE